MSRLAIGIMLAIVLGEGCSRRQKHPENRDVAELRRMLDDPNSGVQVEAARGLGERGEEAAPAVPALIAALGSSDVVVRQQACIALGKIGNSAADAVPALVKTLEDSEWSIRRQSAVAIGQIAPPLAQVEAALQKCEQDPRPLVQKAAREALASLRK